MLDRLPLRISSQSDSRNKYQDVIGSLELFNKPGDYRPVFTGFDPVLQFDYEPLFTDPVQLSSAFAGEAYQAFLSRVQQQQGKEPLKFTVWRKFQDEYVRLLYWSALRDLDPHEQKRSDYLQDILLEP